MIRRGLLSDYFEGVAVKRLSAVEANVLRSNQHEFNSSNQLKDILGAPQRARYPAKFIWLNDEQEALTEDAFLTWYESRKPPRSEHRLYFPDNSVCSAAHEGDTLFIAKRTDGSLLAMITPSASTMESQLLWLFGLEEQPGLAFVSQEIDTENSGALDFAARFILDELEIDFEEPEANKLDASLEQFGMAFPTTRVFSEFARSMLRDVSALDDPDGALLAWIEHEERLFRRLERLIVSERLARGFLSDNEADVDGFLSFSLSVQNRRKSRMGSSLEHHVEAVLNICEIRYNRGAQTEHGNRPDFLFPGSAEYRDNAFPRARLTMLATKSTCKDRWRQVLSEAELIETKHLLTLEPGISESQTSEMAAKKLQLVLPRALHNTYQERQQRWLMGVSDFLELTRARQNK